VAIKLIFNTLSTVTMAKLGRVKGNWMTQVSPTNKKLIDRSIRIVADLLKLSYGDAAERVFGKLAERGADTASLVDEILESR
jgi:N-acetylmuramic acid 6-phosphate etherase